MRQCEEMLRLLDEFEAKIVNEWGASVARRIPELLDLNLILHKDNLLEENFHDDVRILCEK